MPTFLAGLLLAIVRATVALSLSAGIAWGLLSWQQPKSPRLRRTVWWLVLMQGVVLLRIPVTIPWYAPIPPTAFQPSVSPGPVMLDEVKKTEGFERETATHIAAGTAGWANDWQSIAGGLWLVGCGITLLWWAVVYIRIARCGAAGQEPTPDWAEEWQTVRVQQAIRAKIPLRMTMNTGPLLMWRPGGA
jgi:hypothetical protein